MLPILLSGILWGRKQGIAASFLAVLIMDVFFIKPKYGFSVNDIKNLPVFIVFIIVGVSTSFLSDLLRWRIDNYRKQEKFLYTIYNFSKELLKHSSLTDIMKSIVKNIDELLSCHLVILLPNNEDIVKVMTESENCPKFGENEIGIAHWVYKNGKNAGKDTDTLSSSKWLFIPLSANNNIIGVIALIKKESNRSITKDELRYLDSFTNIGAMAISRALSLSNYINYVMKSL
jgi:two-component system sensor histidine kinase KdpD